MQNIFVLILAMFPSLLFAQPEIEQTELKSASQANSNHQHIENTNSAAQNQSITINVDARGNRTVRKAMTEEEKLNAQISSVESKLFLLRESPEPNAQEIAEKEEYLQLLQAKLNEIKEQ